MIKYVVSKHLTIENSVQCFPHISGQIVHSCNCSGSAGDCWEAPRSAGVYHPAAQLGRPYTYARLDLIVFFFLFFFKNPVEV